MLIMISRSVPNPMLKKQNGIDGID
jgi:hypothetical protein